MKYYSLKNILSKKAVYNMIIGERSNGKTYAVLKYALHNYIEGKGQLAILRRWQDDFTGKRGQTMFNSLIDNDEVRKMSKGEWTGIYYWGSRWYLCRYEDNKRIMDETPFAYGFAITSQEHDKSTSYPNITTILFDEFLTRTGYLPDEFILFTNTLSTIIRQRTDVTIFMLGNTVNKYCPYFAEMGLNHIKNQQQGTIDFYQYGNSKLSVAVEYCAPMEEGKPSDYYFAFDNAKLNMITKGVWELDIYPHCPCKYRPKDILFTYFIEWQNELLQCEIILFEGSYFTFIHRKTGELKYPDTDLIFTTQHDMRPNWRRKITKPTSPIETKIAEFFKKDKVFYQDNEIGEIIRNYIQWCTA